MFFRRKREKCGAIRPLCLEFGLEEALFLLNLILLRGMKSKKNLTRFTYENAAFEGWRLCISRGGTTFTKYFPDKKFGGPRKSLDAAENTLETLRGMLEGAPRVKGKLSPSTIRKSVSLLSKL
jgi:hypothetical protein